MSPDDVDPLLAGRAGLGYAELDDCARRLRDLLVTTAERQIGRPLLHEFAIAVDTDPVLRLSPPAGYRRPAAGAVSVRVVVQSRTSSAARLGLRVTVWPALGGADVVDLLVVREGAAAPDGHLLEVRVDEVHPEPTESLQRRVSDVVARQVALVVSDLNIAMQRNLANPDWDGGELG
jgi:hypothetical protein